VFLARREKEMRKAFALLLLLLLPVAAVATDANSDANALDFNASDFNFARVGPIQLVVDFNHQVVGGTGDNNVNDWFFEKSEDFAFTVDFPELDKFYVLDFLDKKTYLYAGVVPVGWSPVIEANQPFSFKINNLFGDADPDLFFLIDDGVSLSIVHLDAGDDIVVVPQRQSRYFLLIDADDLGQASFSLDLGEIEVGVSVLFSTLPSQWAWVEEHGVSCEEEPSHTCIKYPSGEVWDFSACMDKDSSLNADVGQSPGVETCIQGGAAHNSWLIETLAREKKRTEEELAKAVETGDPELALQVAALTRQIGEMSSGLVGLQAGSEESANELLLAGIAILAGIGVIFVYSKVSRPGFRAVTFLNEKIKEAKLNVREKGKEDGKGNAFRVSGTGAESETGVGTEAARVADIKSWW